MARSGIVAVACGALVGAFCLAVVFALPRDAFWVADNGNKALVAERLIETRFASFDFDYPGSRYDPSGRAFPIDPPFVVDRRGSRASVWLPTHPALAAPFRARLGTPGLAVPAALGVAASAGLYVAWIAPFFGVGWAAIGGFVLALATPLLFYGVTVWEHSLAVAAALVASIAVSTPALTPRRLATAGLAIALGCTLRTELALFGIALAVALFALRRRAADLVALAAGAAPIAVALGVVHVVAYGNVLGPHIAANLAAATSDGAERAALALVAAWARTAAGLVGGYGTSASEAVALLLGVAISAGAGTLAALRSGRGRRWIAILSAGVALLVWAYAFVRLTTAADPIAVLARLNGLVLHVPLAAMAGAGLWIVWRRPGAAPLRVPLVASLVFLALAIALAAATRYSAGIHWGPRILLPALPALIALGLAATRAPGLAWAGRALGAAGIASSVFSIWLLAQQLGEARRLTALLAADPAPVIVTTHPLLAQHLAPLWDRKPMLLARDAGEIAASVEGIARAGERSVLLVVPPGSGAAFPTGSARCTLRAEHRGERAKYLDLDVLACEIGARGWRP